MTGERLRDWRAKLGISQSRAAEVCKVRLKTWQGWEQGRPVPDMVELVMCEAERRLKDAEI